MYEALQQTANAQHRDFSADQELRSVREFRNVIRRQPLHRSRLRKYRAELVAMRIAGASYPDLCVWLRINKRIVMHHTSVMRFLKRLPELNNAEF